MPSDNDRGLICGRERRPPHAALRLGLLVELVATLDDLGRLGLEGFGLRRRAASRTWSIDSTRTSLICLRIVRDVAQVLLVLARRITIFAPERWAARSCSSARRSGGPRPRSVISPVIATSLRTGMPVRALTTAVAIVIPADGPSFGIAPAGTWMCRVFFSNTCARCPALRHGPASTTGWHADSCITSPSWPVRMEFLLALHFRDFDGNDVATDLGHNETRRGAGLVLGLELAVVEPLRAKELEQLLLVDHGLALAASATCRATLRMTLAISRSRFRTPAWWVYERTASSSLHR